MINREEVRFGTIAVRSGLITSRQLGEAVCLQLRIDLLEGNHKLLGEVLVDMGLMTMSQVIEVLQSIGKGPSPLRGE